MNTLVEIPTDLWEQIVILAHFFNIPTSNLLADWLNLYIEETCQVIRTDPAARTTVDRLDDLRKRPMLQ